MIVISDKIKNELEKLIANKYVTNYRETSKITTEGNGNYKLVYHGIDGIETVRDRTNSVCLTIRPMVYSDIFNTTIDRDRERLQYLFELEKEVEELRKIKHGIDAIKSLLNTEENK